IGEIFSIRNAPGFTLQEGDSVISGYDQKTFLVELRLTQPAKQPADELVDVFQLQQLTLLAVQDEQVVCPPKVSDIAVRIEIQQFKAIAFSEISTSRREIAPGDMRQQDVLEVEDWLRRIVEAVKKMFELHIAVLAPVIAKQSLSLRAIDVLR